MPRMLISYRREDSAAYAGRLFDRLSDYFGRDNVFIDVDAIKPGQDFVRSIAETIAACDAVIAVIGPRWLTERDASGARRLDRAEDLLRVELATALARGVPVFPVLVGGAVMPEPGDLPGDVAKLGRLQALRLDDTEFHHDVHKLIETVNATVAPSRPVKPPWSVIKRITRSGALRWWGLAAAAAIIVVTLAWWRRGPETGLGEGTLRYEPASESSSASTSPLPAGPSEAVALIAGPAPPVRVLSRLGTIDDPIAVEPRITYQLLLEADETAFMRLTTPVADPLIIADMRSGSGESTNLQSQLSLLDADGATILANVVVFNEIDHGWRHTKALSLGRQPRAITVKLVNGNLRNAFWLTLFDTPRVPFVPFFGRIVPLAPRVGQIVAGELEPGEDAYVAMTLMKGNYKVVADLVNVPREKTNIQGYVAALDPFGGSQNWLIRFNEIDFAFRKTATLTVPRDGSHILRLQNGHHAASYSLRLTAEAPAPSP